MNELSFTFEKKPINQGFVLEEGLSLKERTRDYKITNIGSALLVDGGAKTLRLDGSFEVLSTPNGMLSLLLSPERADLCAAYIPGIDIIRVGQQALRELHRSPDAIARIFAHETCHQRFFQATAAEQRRFVDILCGVPDVIKPLIEKFYSSRFGNSYQGSHDKDFVLPEPIVGGEKSGLRDSRLYCRPNGQVIRIANFATELYAYMSPLFLQGKEQALLEEARAHKETMDFDGFFGALPSLLETIRQRASATDQSLLKRMYIDTDPRSIAKFQNALKRAEERIAKNTRRQAA